MLLFLYAIKNSKNCNVLFVNGQFTIEKNQSNTRIKDDYFLENMYLQNKKNVISIELMGKISLDKLKV